MSLLLRVEIGNVPHLSIVFCLIAPLHSANCKRELAASLQYGCAVVGNRGVSDNQPGVRKANFRQFPDDLGAATRMPTPHQRLDS